MRKTQGRSTAPIIIAMNLVLLTVVMSCATYTSSNAEQIDVVRSIFPDATEMSEIPISRDVRNSGRPGYPKISQINTTSALLGYCVETEVVSRSGPFKIRVLLDSQYRIKQAVVTSYPGKRGRDVRSPGFTDQFKGKGPGDPIRLGIDIDAISGATISSAVMTEGIHEIVKLVKNINENRAVAQMVDLTDDIKAVYSNDNPPAAQVVDSTNDIKTLYSRNCSSCHSLIEPGRFSRDDMSKYINKYGKELASTEKEHLLQYLIDPDEDIGISAKETRSF